MNEGFPPIYIPPHGSLATTYCLPHSTESAEKIVRLVNVTQYGGHLWTSDFSEMRLRLCAKPSKQCSL
jgi:hypothetical protein